MARPQVAILSNPRCAHNKKYMPLIRSVVAKSKNIFHFELDEDATIPEALTQFSRTKPALLIINGGDTTIHTSLNFLMNSGTFETMPVLAVLATGRANKLAHDLGLAGSPSKVLERLIHIAQIEGMETHTIEKPVIKLDTADGRSPFYGVYFKGGALVGQLAHAKDKLKGLPLPKFIISRLAYVRVLLRTLGRGYKSKNNVVGYVPQGRIRLRGAGEVSGRFISLLATTLNKLPSRRKPFGRFGKGHMGFSAVDYGFMSSLRAVKALFLNKIGKVSMEGVHTRRSSEIIITGARAVTLDGEYIDIDPEKEITLNADGTISFIYFEKKGFKPKA